MIELQQKILKMLFYAQLLIEANDDLRGTDFYKGKVKQHANVLTNALNKELSRQLKAIHEADPEMYINIMNNIDELLENMGRAELGDMVMVNQIFEHYKNNREDWNNLFQLELQKVKE
ncbi:hypothetical protein [Galbibacter sp. BG1]